jgi:hypothetical protein
VAEKPAGSAIILAESDARLEINGRSLSILEIANVPAHGAIGYDASVAVPAGRTPSCDLWLFEGLRSMRAGGPITTERSARRS